MTDRTCTVPECGKPLRSPGATYCAMHYHRWYRHGSVDRCARSADAPSASKGRRYIRRANPTHPMAMKNGNVWEHRAVLFDAIGYGPHPCHWCQHPVDWRAEHRPDQLHVDHLDGMGDNNDLANLVPSCPTCNTGRGSTARHEAMKEAGWWSNHDTVAALGGRRETTPW